MPAYRSSSSRTQAVNPVRILEVDQLPAGSSVRSRSVLVRWEEAAAAPRSTGAAGAGPVTSGSTCRLRNPNTPRTVSRLSDAIRRVSIGPWRRCSQPGFAYARSQLRPSSDVRVQCTRHPFGFSGTARSRPAARRIGPSRACQTSASPRLMRAQVLPVEMPLPFDRPPERDRHLRRRPERRSFDHHPRRTRPADTVVAPRPGPPRSSVWF